MVQLPNSQDIEYKIFVDSIHASYIYLPIIPYSDEEQWLKKRDKEMPDQSYMIWHFFMW